MISLPKNMKTFLQQQQKAKVLFTVCPECSKILSLDLVIDQPEQIHLYCPSCNYEETVLLIDFLDHLKSNENPKCENSAPHPRVLPQGIEFCPQCNKWLCIQCLLIHSKLNRSHKTFKGKITVESNCPSHKEKVYEYFCKNCKKHFCSLCLNQHQEHQYCQLSNMMNKDVIRIINEKYARTKDIFKENEQIKELTIKLLNEEIKLVENAYSFNKEINDNLTQLIDILISNYTKGTSNYYINQNILNYSHFNVSSRLELEGNEITLYNIDKVVNYFNTQFILKDFKIPIIEKTQEQQKQKDKTEVSLLSEVKEINEHTKPVYCLTLLINGRLATCSPDRSIKLFDLNKYKCVLTIPHAHSTTVTYLCQLKDWKLVSSGADGLIKIWEISKSGYKCVSQFKAHTDYINKIINMTKDRFATCSRDSTIKVWSSKDYTVLNDLAQEHSKNVTSIIQLKNGYLISGSDDKILTCNSPSLKAEKEFTPVECSDANAICEVDSGYFIVGGDKIIYVVRIDLEQFLRIPIDDLGIVYSLSDLGNNQILMGTSEGIIYQFDLENKEIMIKKEEAHKGCVYSIGIIGDNLIASSGYDGKVKIWENID